MSDDVIDSSLKTAAAVDDIIIRVGGNIWEWNGWGNGCGWRMNVAEGTADGHGCRSRERNGQHLWSIFIQWMLFLRCLWSGGDMHVWPVCWVAYSQANKQTDWQADRQAHSLFGFEIFPFHLPRFCLASSAALPPHLPSPPPTAVNKAFQNNNEFCWKCIGMILLCSKKFDCKWQVHSNEPTNRWTNKGTDRQIKEQRDRQTKGLTKGRTAAASAMNYEQRICCVRPVGQKVHLSNVTEVELRFSVFA